MLRFCMTVNRLVSFQRQAMQILPSACQVKPDLLYFLQHFGPHKIALDTTVYVYSCHRNFWAQDITLNVVGVGLGTSSGHDPFAPINFQKLTAGRGHQNALFVICDGGSLDFSF